MPKSFLINLFFVFMLRFRLFDYLDKHVFMLSGMLRNDSGLLFYDLPKRGPVEILARSSISPESQTKVNVKVTASR